MVSTETPPPGHRRPQARSPTPATFLSPSCPAPSALKHPHVLRELSTFFSLFFGHALGMLKLKLQSFGHLIQRADPLEKTLMLRKTEGGRRSVEGEMVRWSDDSKDVSLSKFWETVKNREAWSRGQ